MFISKYKNANIFFLFVFNHTFKVVKVLKNNVLKVLFMFDYFISIKIDDDFYCFNSCI